MQALQLAHRAARSVVAWIAVLIGGYLAILGLAAIIWPAGTRPPGVLLVSCVELLFGLALGARGLIVVGRIPQR